MNRNKILLATLLAASVFAGPSAYAQSWVGTADYTAGSSEGDEDVVGPFNTYDAGAGVVLLESTGMSGGNSTFNGVYQSYVTKHELSGVPVVAAGLDDTYELTAVATFTESVSATGEITVTGGTFNLYRDTTRDRDYTTDSGFSDGEAILTGTITSGAGAAAADLSFGVTDLTIQITGYDTSVYNPDTIATGGGIFTLRMGSELDAPFLSGITSVGGNSYDVASGDLLYAADGYLALAVPEAETYAMMLAGLGLVGFMARRRTRSVI